MAINLKKLGPVVTLSVLGVVCGSVLLAIFMGPRILAYQLSRQVANGRPELMIVPQPLQELEPNSAPGMAMSKFGYQFELPWKDLDRIDDHKSLSLMIFKSGRTVMFMDPKKALDRVKSLLDAASKEGRDPTKLFGPDAMASNYAFVKATLSATPRRFSLLSPINEMVRDSVLLMMKGTETTNAESGLYSVEVHGFRGFQKGNPVLGKGLVNLQMFDDQDHEVYLTISTRNRGTAPITQRDLNRILQTLRPVADAH